MEDVLELLIIYAQILIQSSEPVEQKNGANKIILLDDNMGKLITYCHTYNVFFRGLQVESLNCYHNYVGRYENKDT